MLSKKAVSQSNVVIVLGAGPSISKNIVHIKNYLKKHAATTISANYQYDNLNIDYTLFVDKEVYHRYHTKVKKQIIIGQAGAFRKYYNDENRIIINHVDSPAYLHVKKIKISGDGLINHQVGNAGFASILVSYFFNPIKVIICGFDGPQKRKYINAKKKTKKYIKPYYIKKNKTFLKKLLLFLQQNNIQIISFNNDTLWGIEKRTIGIKTVNKL